MTFSNSNAPNEKVFEYLSSEGYRPKYDEDGDIIVKREGKTFAIIFEENDPIYFRVLYPNFWSLDDETEYEQATIATARVDRTLKCVKALPSVEFNEDANVSHFSVFGNRINGNFLINGVGYNDIRSVNRNSAA